MTESTTSYSAFAVRLCSASFLLPFVFSGLFFVSDFSFRLCFFCFWPVFLFYMIDKAKYHISFPRAIQSAPGPLVLPPPGGRQPAPFHPRRGCPGGCTRELEPPEAAPTGARHPTNPPEGDCHQSRPFNAQPEAGHLRLVEGA